MKMLRKTLSAVLVLAVLLPSILTVSASHTTFPLLPSERLLLIDVLSDIEPQKSLWGLENVDFDELNVGESIQIYNYVEGIFERSHEVYPLTIDDRLVLWAIPINGQFQITSSLVSEINASIDFDTPFALVYDVSKAYIYANQSFSVLKCFDAEIESRSVLSTNTRLAAQGIDIVSLSQSTSLDYEGNAQNTQRTTPTNVSCSVNYVTQNPPSNLCWAASTACIVNYINGTTLNAESVAKKYYGNTNFNQGIGCDDLVNKIKGYGLNYYQFVNYGDFDNKIFGSLCANNPVGGTFDVINGKYHATVIYGINILAGRIQVMDPEFGMTTASLNSSGDYSYVSSYANTTLVLYGISYDTGD